MLRITNIYQESGRWRPYGLPSWRASSSSHLSLAKWNALSIERKDNTTYHSFPALTQENAGLWHPAPAAPAAITTATDITTVTVATNTTTTTAEKRCSVCRETGHVKRLPGAGRPQPPPPSPPPTPPRLSQWWLPPPPANDLQKTVPQPW
ncbi:hypothetical protein J3F84DRAFT_404648 [Trichoderma pleuroticola]